MAQVIIACLLLVLGLVLAIFLARSDEETDANIGKIGGPILIIGSIILFITSTFTIVPPGHMGVQVTFGSVNETVIPEGFNMVNPLSSVTHMSARVEKDEETQPAETADTQIVHISVITNWRPQANKLAWLYKNYGEKYPDKIIPPAIRESVKAEIAKHKVTDIVLKRHEIHQAVQQNINTWLNKYGLEVLEVGIANIKFSDTYNLAIEAKQVQEQEALKKTYELQKTETEAKMAAAQAKGRADSAIAEATGKAQALQIEGEAQAAYNQKVSNSLSNLLIQRMYLDKWDGKLPGMITGDHTGLMMTIPAVQTK